MKILSVRFKNLNSLVGEWKVDFTSSDYDGIFAITGPTGAGKSTLLDAICLGLYGRTPRLNKVSKGNNEIMSQLTGECFSEVEFETEKGHFRCRWEQHRARRKAEGDLQTPRHEICEVTTGKIFQTRSRGVLNTIEEVTGMDFERFTRSMLLAQGDFSAFLQASADERSPILEQITGTEIYSKISQKVFEITREQEQALDELKAALGEIQLLSCEEEIQLQKSLLEDMHVRHLQGQALEKDNEELVNLQQIESISRQLETVKENQLKLKQDFVDFESKEKRLKKALDAENVEPIYQRVKDKQAQAGRMQSELVNGQKALALLDQNKQTLELVLKDQSRHLAQTLAKEDEMLALVDQVLKLDASIDQLRSNLSLKMSEKTQLGREISLKEAKCSELSTLIMTLKKALLPHESYQRENANDALLCEVFSGLLRQVENYEKDELSLKNLRKNSQILSEQVCEEKLKLEKMKVLANQIENQLQNKKSLLAKQQILLNEGLAGRLLREYRSDLKSLTEKRELLRIIASFEEHRKQLADGQPCPLCGATHHPYAQGNIPKPSALDAEITALQDRIEHIEEVEEKCKHISDSLKKIEADKLKIESGVTECEMKISLLENTQKQEEDSIGNATLSLTNARDALVKAFSFYIEHDFVGEANWRRLLQDLNHRVKAWKANETSLQKIGLDLQKAFEEKGQCEVALRENKAQWESINKQFNVQKVELDDKKQCRQTLFGQKDPTQERLIFNQELKNLRNAIEVKTLEKSQLEQKISALLATIKTKKSALEELNHSLKIEKGLFDQALLQYGFVETESFIEACLDPDEKQSLILEQTQLRERSLALNSRELMLNEQRQKAVARQTEQITIESLLERIEQKKVQYEKLLQIMATKQATLEHNAKEKQRLGQKQEQLDRVTKTVQEWQALRALIGSADGKKFRNFAQGLTLDVVIGYANAHLQKMSDRYLLVRGCQEPLQLEVVDSYQAGEIRSTKNLSGGESFIVSLALALGLSSMSSEKVSVDSLFLDEGFGTLDANALEMALETLSQLQENGKLIGVISHVQALKDRIGTQIEVIPQNGGNSWLKGPGCVRISS